MQHRLLILGSLDEFVELVRQSRQRGYYTVVCDGYPDGPAKKVADRAYDIDVRDVDAVVEMCRREQVDGIIGSFSDLLFEKITEIAAKVPLRWYAVPENLKYYREKNETKALLRELGVRVPKNRILPRDFSDRDLEGFEFPLVIKPINGYGSKGIFVVRSVDEIREKYGQVTCRSTLEQIQVEEYSHGREYNMMTWLLDGKVHVISIADREKNPQEGDRIPLLNRVVYPARAIRQVIGEATQVLQKFADRIGQREGALSMQFFYNEHGVEVCEIAGRLFGYEHELVTHCCGLNIETLLLDYVYDTGALRETLLRHSPFFETCSAGLYFVGRQGKTIRKMDKVQTLARDPHVVHTLQFYQPGDTIDNYGAKSYFVRYYLTARSREELDEVTEHFFQSMQVEAEDGSQVLYPFILEK